MLAARRDPVFDHGTHEPSTAPAVGHAGAHATPRPTSFARFVAGLQILGTVLGIPLGLASGYSIYRANFSPEAKCGGLRANIISMLDKNTDAATLRLLVHRDVATFEHSCATVDPDAVAAFRTLLTKPTVVAAVPKTVRAVREAKVIRPAKVERKVEKKTSKKVAHAAPAEHVAHAKADADWLAAVRRALVEHGPVTRAQAAEAPVQLAPASTAPAVAQPMGTLLSAPARAQAAPALPPATAVVDTPKNDESHPVPPALIPDAGSPAGR